jgi:uncharacterized protein YjbJ (UPF0337 family)
MLNSTKDQIEGTLHEAKGAVKEKIGEIVNDSTLEAEGLAERLAGTLQKKAGQVERVMGN